MRTGLVVGMEVRNGRLGNRMSPECRRGPSVGVKPRVQRRWDFRAGPSLAKPRCGSRPGRLRVRTGTAAAGLSRGCAR